MPPMDLFYRNQALFQLVNNVTERLTVGLRQALNLENNSMTISNNLSSTGNHEKYELAMERVDLLAHIIQLSMICGPDSTAKHETQ